MGSDCFSRWDGDLRVDVPRLFLLGRLCAGASDAEFLAEGRRGIKNLPGQRQVDLRPPVEREALMETDGGRRRVLALGTERVLLFASTFVFEPRLEEGDGMRG